MHPGWTRVPLPRTVTPAQKKSNFHTVVVILCLPVILLIRFGCLLAGPHPASDPSVERINAIVNEFRDQLQMLQAIEVTVVPVNNRMVSVEHTAGKAGEIGLYTMCFDENFLASLDDDELRAAIAHELGHVWIFSHHPYLQTEALANEIAMRVVSRESLKKIYNKLWIHLGVTGSLDEFLGIEKVHSAQR
jgi:hypothetical protein